MLKDTCTRRNGIKKRACTFVEIIQNRLKRPVLTASKTNYFLMVLTNEHLPDHTDLSSESTLLSLNPMQLE